MQFDFTRRQMVGVATLGGLSLLPTLSFAKAKKAKKETRVLPLFNRHTGETLEVAYYKDGQYLDKALAEINYFLRDHREQSSTEMDLRVINQLYDLHRVTGSSQSVQIISAYRTSKTNTMLRKRSGGGVAKRSYHMQGRAVDFYIPDVKLSKLAEAAISAKRGGVGVYPRSHFIHVDSGPVRNWAGA